MMRLSTALTVPNHDDTLAEPHSMALRCRAIDAAPRPINQIGTLEPLPGSVFRMSRRGLLTAEERDEAPRILQVEPRPAVARIRRRNPHVHSQPSHATHRDGGGCSRLGAWTRYARSGTAAAHRARARCAPGGNAHLRGQLRRRWHARSPGDQLRLDDPSHAQCLRAVDLDADGDRVRIPGWPNRGKSRTTD